MIFHQNDGMYCICTSLVKIMIFNDVTLNPVFLSELIILQDDPTGFYVHIYVCNIYLCRARIFPNKIFVSC